MQVHIFGPSSVKCECNSEISFSILKLLKYVFGYRLIWSSAKRNHPIISLLLMNFESCIFFAFEFVCRLNEHQCEYSKYLCAGVSFFLLGFRFSYEPRFWGQTNSLFPHSAHIGTTNTPEYYINMRTGTHYFPRGVNAVAAVERSRQKFGLNKIEETVGETMCTTSITAAAAAAASNAIISNHRRTESCDLSHRRQSSTTAITATAATTTTTANTTNNILGNSNNNCNSIAGAPIVSKEVNSLLQENTHSRMSPDLQRHLAYQTYRGFECKSKYK